MRLIGCFLLVGAVASITSPVLAAASPDVAKQLEREFAGCLGSEPDLARVTSLGDAYEVHLDVERAIKTWMTRAGVSAEVKMSPLIWKMTPRGRGKWTVEMDQPVSFTLRNGPLALEYSIQSAKTSGSYDETEGYYNDVKGDYAGISISEMVGPPGHTTSIRYAIDTMSYQAGGTGTAEAVNTAGHYTSSGFKETLDFPAATGGSAKPMTFTISSRSATADTAAQGMNAKAMNKLLRWIVAHPGRREREADRAVLRQLLRDALPVLKSLHSTSLLSDLKVDVGGKVFAADRARLDMEMTGLIADARFGERLEFSGIHMPSATVPAWADGMVPTRIMVDFKITGFNLLAPAGLAAEKIEPGKSPLVPASISAALWNAFLPKGYATFELAAADVSAPLYHATAKGALDLRRAQPASGEVTIQMDGMDAVNGALLDAHAAQALALFTVASAAAEEDEQGKLTWRIEKPRTGELLVNDVPLQKILRLMQ